MQQNALTAFFQDTVGWFRQGAYSTTTSHLYFADGFIEILNPLMARNADGHSTFNWSGLGYVAFTLLLAWLPVLGLLWGGQLILQKRATPASFRLFWCAGVLLLISTLTYSTGFQIGVTGFFGYLLGFMCLQHWLEPRAGKRVYPFLTLFLAAYMGLNFKNALEIFRNPANWISSYGTAEKHYNLEHGETVGTKYARMTELIQTFSASQAPVFVFNASPELYFLSGRKPATRFLIIYPVYTTEPQRREILESLQKNQPPVIVYDGKMENLHRDFRFKHLPKAKLDLPELWDYLNRHYQYSQQGRYTIMIPLQPAPSGQALR